MLQTRSTRCIAPGLQHTDMQTATKTHPCTEVKLVGKEGSGAAESC